MFPSFHFFRLKAKDINLNLKIHARSVFKVDARFIMFC